MLDRESDANALDGMIRPYLEVDGVHSAALISVDGLLVARVGHAETDFELVAARAASLVAEAHDLAAVSGPAPLKLLSLHTAGGGLVIAPLTDDLLILLIGDKGIVAGGGIIVP